MPSYISSPQVSQVKAIYPGNQIALVNSAATDSGVTKTLQAAVGPQPDGNPRLSVQNTTNQTATAEYATSDADGNYQPLKNGDTGTAITVATNTSITFEAAIGWVRFTFGTAPTSGSLILAR